MTEKVWWAVKWLFNQETIKINGKVKKYYPRYEIDYNCCKSQNVKNKMKNLTWSLKWELYYDSNSKTYYIEWKNWKKIPAKNIWIYEWVRLKREEIKQYEAHIEDERKKEELWKVDVDKKSNDKPENDPELKQYIDDIPKELREELEKLWNEEYRTFIISVENELADILRENIKLWYNLQGEFVSTDPLWINITIDLINSNINETKM